MNRKGLKYLKQTNKKKSGFLPGVNINWNGILEFQLSFGVTIKKLFDIWIFSQKIRFKNKFFLQNK